MTPYERLKQGRKYVFKGIALLLGASVIALSFFGGCLISNRIRTSELRSLSSLFAKAADQVGFLKQTEYFFTDPDYLPLMTQYTNAIAETALSLEDDSASLALFFEIYEACPDALRIRSFRWEDHALYITCRTQDEAALRDFESALSERIQLKSAGLLPAGPDDITPVNVIPAALLFKKADTADEDEELPYAAVVRLAF